MLTALQILTPPRQTTRLPADASLVTVPTRPGLIAPGRVHFFPLNSRYPDAVSIIGILNQLADAYGRMPELREAAISLLSRDIGDNDQEKHFRSICDFVRDRVYYVRDPRGAEYVVSPVKLLEDIRKHGRAHGDCDDHVLLLNSLLNSLGFHTKVMGTKINGSELWNHVFSSVLVHHEWRDVDPIFKHGWDPDYTVRLEP